MTPARFFLEVVPALGKLRARAFPALKEPISVVVDHEAFTLTLHDDVTRARAGGDPSAPFQLYLSTSAFERLLDGTLDVDDALAKKQVGFRGDLRVLAQLGRLLSGAGSSVDVRVR